MIVHRAVPEDVAIELGEVLSGFAPERRPQLQPFAPEVLSFIDCLSGAVFRDAEARRFPELQALAFWMRRTELTKLERDFRAMEGPDLVFVPRGLVFHIPPSNVDTIFMYSWLLSLLAGNCSVLRISSRGGGASSVLLRLVGATLAGAAEPVRRSIAMLRYEHDPRITARISAACDVRVIWGGDQTVETIRQSPLPPHSVELAFPDRYSLAAIRTQAYLDAEETQRKLARNFYNDAFWFDQMACSSPRVLLWCGGDQAAVDCAQQRFFSLLEEEIAASGYALDAGNRIRKLTYVFRAVLDEPVTRYHAVGTECSVLTLAELRHLTQAHCGGGLIYQAHVDDVRELASLVTRKHQTLTYFGFELADLRALAHTLNGRGIDRIVPIGQALSFNRYWDGNDLLRSFTRLVSVAG